MITWVWSFSFANTSTCVIYSGISLFSTPYICVPSKILTLSTGNSSISLINSAVISGSLNIFSQLDPLFVVRLYVVLVPFSYPPIILIWNFILNLLLIYLTYLHYTLKYIYFLMKIHLNQTKYFTYTRKKLEPKIPPRFEFYCFYYLIYIFKRRDTFFLAWLTWHLFIFSTLY